MNENNKTHKHGPGECLCKHRLFVPKTPCLSGPSPEPVCRSRRRYGTMKKTTHQYHLWMSEEENAELTRLCNLTGLSKANLIRKLIMSKPVKERPNADFAELRSSIDRIGVNFNQLVHRANAEGFVMNDDFRMARFAFERVLALMREWEAVWR